MKLLDVVKIAEKYKLLFQPYCKRIEIAGSIRRKKEEVKDIEIVCIPDSYHLEYFLLEGKFRMLKNGGKYKQIMLQEAIKLDLFICSPETWAMNFLVRTGSANYVHRFMIEITRRGYYSKDARLYKIPSCEDDDGEAINVSEEEDVFKAVGMKWLEPEKRI